MKNDEFKILNVKVDFGYTLQSAVDRILELLSDGRYHQICTTNPEFILEAQHNPEFMSIINNSDLSLPDGVGVLYAKKFLDETRKLKRGLSFPLMAILVLVKVVIFSFLKKNYLGERVSGVSLVDRLCSLSEEGRNLSVFFLGGWPKDAFGKMMPGEHNVASVAAENLKRKYPKMNIIGATSSFGPSEKDDKRTLAFIHESMQKSNIDTIDIVFVAYGHPKQEIWIKRVSNEIPALVSIGVGGTFDYFSGTQKNAPSVFVMLNIEWLFRLATQPWRFKRIFSALLYFPFLVYKSTLK